MQPWFERYPDRFETDRKELEAIGFSLDKERLEKDKTVEYRGRLPEFPERELILSFPSGYPSQPPKCRDDDSQPLLKRHHRALNRDFCIFGREASRWNVGESPVRAIEEVEDVLKRYSDSSNLPDAEEDPVPEPVSNNLPYKDDFFVLIPPPVSQLISEGLEDPDDGYIKIKKGKNRITKDLSIDRAIVAEISLKKYDDILECDNLFKNNILNWIKPPKNEKGKLYYLPVKVESPVTFDLLKELAQNFGFKVHPSSWYGFIIKEESGHRLNEQHSLMLFHQPEKSAPYPVRTMQLKNNSTNIRIPGLEWLDKKKVAVIGCGAIGSRIAVDLASTGLSNFVLIDPDSIEPDNAVRHQAGPFSFGLPKVIALRKEIHRKNPEAHAISLPVRFGDIHPHSIEEKLLEAIQSCDLIVNATGNDHTSRYINEVCCDLDMPGVHVSVTNGAWSGEAVRFIPGVTPCWMCWDYQNQDRSPAGEPVTSEGIYARGCDQPTFTGTIYDIGGFSSAATSFSVDALRIADGKNPQFNDHYLLWKNFNNQGQPVMQAELRPIEFRTPCSFCNS